MRPEHEDDASIAIGDMMAKPFGPQPNHFTRDRGDVGGAIHASNHRISLFPEVRLVAAHLPRKLQVLVHAPRPSVACDSLRPDTIGH